MGGIRPETRAMKRRKIKVKEDRRMKRKTPNRLGIPPKKNLLRKQLRDASAKAAVAVSK